MGYLCTNFSLLRPSVLELGPMYATDRRQTKASINASAPIGRRHNNDRWEYGRRSIVHIAGHVTRFQTVIQ